MKKRNAKRVATIAMAAVMMGTVGVPAAVMPVTALADETDSETKITEDRCFQYQIITEYGATSKKTGAEIVAINIKEAENDAGHVSIPKTITDPETNKTYDVIKVHIGDVYDIKSISFPSSVTNISINDLNSLKNLIIPEDGAPITNLDITSCLSLKSIVVPKRAGNNFFFADNENLKHVTLQDGITKIPDGAFQECSDLESIALPKTVQSIGEEAFDKCISLKDISLPAAVENINMYAFNKCTSLEEIAIPGHVHHIGVKAFSDCENLKTLYLPENISVIQEDAFSHCYSLGKDQGGKIYYGGSSSNWKKIFIDSGNEMLNNTNIEYAKQDEAEQDVPDDPDNKNDVAELNKKIDQLEKQINELKGSGTSGNSSSAVIYQDSPETKAQIASLTKQVADLQEQVKQLQGTNTDSQRQISKMQEKIDSYDAKLVKVDRIENVAAKTKKGKKVTVSWNKSDVNDLDGYRVYYSPKKTSGYKKFAATKNLNVTKKVKSAAGNKVYFKVRGYKKINGKTVWTKYSDSTRVKLHK